jgi:hypothetical protein
LALNRNGEEKAGANRLAIKQYGACSADTVFATNMRSRELQVVPKKIGEESPSRNIARARNAIDGHVYIKENFAH